MPCDRDACMAALGNGSWRGTTWVWPDGHPPCCELGQVGADRAQQLLRGRRIVFVGDSTARRHMWAIADVVGAQRAIRRRPGAAVADSNVGFDSRALAVNDTIYDSQRAYHAGQVVLLNVDSGAWRLLDPLQLCGVPRDEWTVDAKLVHAARRGEPPPWARMRGTRYRILLELAPRCDEAAEANNGSLACARPLRPAGDRLRAVLQSAARAALRSWGCQAASKRDCGYHDAVQRDCARGIAVRRSPDAAAQDHGWSGRRSRRARGGGGRRGARGGGARGGARGAARAGGGGGAGRRLGEARRAAAVWRFEVRMGDGGAACRRACEALQQRLADALGAGGARRGAAWLEAGTARALAAVRPVAPPRIAPVCEQYCRASFSLSCKGGFDKALSAAVEAHAGALELPPRRADALAVLIFLYGASLEEWQGTFDAWAPAAVGYGADAVLLGATWDHVSTPKRAAGPAALAWAPARAAAWARALAACAAAAGGLSSAAQRPPSGPPPARGAAPGRCVLRTVAEQLRQPQPQPYREFVRRVAPLARAAGVPLVEQFEGTWAGAAAGVLRHHDTTRIHFSDAGRAFLAQLSLHALALALPRRALPPPRRAAAIDLDELVRVPPAR